MIGGSYFVGRRLVENFVCDGHEVSVLNRGSHLLPEVEQLTADRNEPEQMRAALADRSFDCVVDASCYTAQQAQIAQAALNGRFSHFIHLSSSAVYVEDETIPMAEDHPTGRSPQWGDYGLHKWQADQFLLEQVRVSRSPITILRPPYIYGPGNNLEREQFVWSRLLRERPILLPGLGDTPVQFLHTDELYTFIHLVLAHPDCSRGEVYNVANPELITFRGWVELLAELAGVAPSTVAVAYEDLGKKPRDFFPFRDYPCVLDVRKAERILNWKPLFNLRTGFHETFKTYDQNRLATRPIDTVVEDEMLARVTAASGGAPS